MNIKDFIKELPILDSEEQVSPWALVARLPELVLNAALSSNDEYIIRDGIAIHLTAHIEPGAVIKAPAVIGANCFVGANAYIRGGVYLSSYVSIGPGSEIKSSFIGSNTAAAHFNFIGDSLIGSFVNFEAGAVIANHYNERVNKEITVFVNGSRIQTGITKFGALVGDNVRIGANAVLSPGTVLSPGQIIKRLELVEQVTHSQN